MAYNRLSDMRNKKYYTEVAQHLGSMIRNDMIMNQNIKKRHTFKEIDLLEGIKNHKMNRKLQQT